jgi:plastocyanin
MKKRLVGAAAVVAAGLAAVSLAFGGTTTLKLSADKTKLAYNKKALAAPAGKVTIVMKNPSFLQHDVAIKVNSKVHKSKLANKGQTVKLTVKLKPGTYTFYCTVPGHEAAGMKGKLVVK